MWNPTRRMSRCECAGVLTPSCIARGYTGDPQYHKVTDVVDRPDYDTTQLALTARVALAAAASFAEIVFE